MQPMQAEEPSDVHDVQQHRLPAVAVGSNCSHTVRRSPDALVQTARAVVLELGACYAFVQVERGDTHPSDAGWLTRLEERETIPGLTSSGHLEQAERVTRWARGAFWGNFLGPRQVERLGGAARVLREAPRLHS